MRCVFLLDKNVSLKKQSAQVTYNIHRTDVQLEHNLHLLLSMRSLLPPQCQDLFYNIDTTYYVRIQS